MESKIKKFFFPFLKQNQEVRKFWFHRLIEVVFFLVIFTTLILLWRWLNLLQMNSFNDCSLLQNYLVQGIKDCRSIYDVHPWQNFGLALLCVVLISYIFQLIYFKVILWIVFGSSKKDIKTLVMFLGIIFFGFSSNIVFAAFNKDLYYGMENENQITELQSFLTSQNLYSGPITGNYYSLTREAVRKLQIREGIYPASGYFGPKTRMKVAGFNSGVVVPTEKSTTTDIADILSRLGVLEQKLNEVLKNGNVDQNTNKTNDISTGSTSENRPTQTPEVRVENVLISKPDPIFAPELILKKDVVIADGTNKIEVTIKSKLSDGTLASYRTMKIKMPYLSEKLWVIADAYGLATVSVPVERVEKKVVLGQCGSQSGSTPSYVTVSLLDKDTENILVSKSVRIDPVIIAIPLSEQRAINGSIPFSVCE